MTINDAAHLPEATLRRMLDQIDAHRGDHDDWSREERWPPLQITPATRHKLELDGATNPAFYRPTLKRELERKLFGLPARRAKRR